MQLCDVHGEVEVALRDMSGRGKGLERLTDGWPGRSVVIYAGIVVQRFDPERSNPWHPLGAGGRLIKAD